MKAKGDTKEVLQRKTGRGEVNTELDFELLHPEVEYVFSLYTKAKAEAESETDALDVKEFRHSESSPVEQTFIMGIPPPRDLQLESTSTSSIKVIICLLEVFLDGSPLGLLDFVLHALRALRPCDPSNDALDSEQTLVLVFLIDVLVLFLLLLLLLLLVVVVAVVILLLLVVVVVLLLLLLVVVVNLTHYPSVKTISNCWIVC